MATHRELSGNRPPTYAEDEWFQHRELAGLGVADFCGFPGHCGE
jgi:hypothetical protein